MNQLAIYGPFFRQENGREVPLMDSGAVYVFEPDILAPHQIPRIQALGEKIAQLGGVAVVVAAGTDRTLLANTLRELVKELENGYMPGPSLDDVTRWHAEYSA